MTVDGNIYTAGGITAGIDMALRVAAVIAGDEVAQQLQLQIEYDPEPPFKAGTPRNRRAGPDRHKGTA